MPPSIRDMGRAFRRRFSHPPAVKLGTSLASMPVGKGGYLTISDVVVGWDGQAWADPYEGVDPSPWTPFDERVFFVERTSEHGYALTAIQGKAFPGSSQSPAADAVRFGELYEAPRLVNPHHRRVRVEALRVDAEPGVERPSPGPSAPG